MDSCQVMAPSKLELRKLLQGFLSQERVPEAHVLIGMLRLVGLPVDVVCRLSPTPTVPEPTPTPRYPHPSPTPTVPEPIIPTHTVDTHPLPPRYPNPSSPPTHGRHPSPTPTVPEPGQVMYNLLMTAYKKRRQWQLVIQEPTVAGAP